MGTFNIYSQMTIQEAIKSGKPFKRILDSEWLVIDKYGDFQKLDYFADPDDEFVLFSSGDILYDDWEIKE